MTEPAIIPYRRFIGEDDFPWYQAAEVAAFSREGLADKLQVPIERLRPDPRDVGLGVVGRNAGAIP